MGGSESMCVNGSMMFALIAGAIALIAVIAAIAIYNRLVSLKRQTENAWAQIDVQLKRRFDLIPNLIETVKGYAAHERGVLERVTQARAGVTQAGNNPEARIAAEGALSGALHGLMVQVEAYPQLKADTNFLALQEELSSTENKISFARQHYNDSATVYNTRTSLFPDNIFAGMFGFKEAPLWQITDAAERQVPKVQF